MADRRPEIAEAMGVFLLVAAGCGAIMVNAMTGGLGAVGVGLVFGLAIVVLVYALGHLCGAHFNPAITLAFALTGHFPWRRVPTYVGAQVVGATAAAFLLRLLLGDRASLGATMPAPDVSIGVAFAIEVLATFFLALVIVAVATDRRVAPGAAGIAIGFTVLLDALAFGPLTGASMNPARSLGPAIASASFADLWIYLAAPLLGAALAMLAYEWLRPGAHGIRAKEPALGATGPIAALQEGSA